MNLEMMRERMRDAKENLDDIRARAMRLAGGNPTDEEMDQCEKDLKAAKRRYDLIKGECEEAEKEQQRPQAMKPVDKPEEKNLKSLLASNEYARAWALALRMGAKADRSTGYDERLKPIYDALTIAGGDPAGSEGGFLVPEDIDHTIREVMREMNPLSSLVTEENVSTNSGWRVMDNAPTKGFTLIEGELEAIPEDDQPSFAKVSFTLQKYGLIVPLSNELVADEVANLMAYLGRWFGRKLVIHENGLVNAALKTLSPVSAGAAAGLNAAVKKALNVTLDPAISRSAVIVTNQTGFDMLDQEMDGNKRPLLQPDPANATGYRVLGRPLHVISNQAMPDLSGGAPLYAGNLKQFATLFRRMPLRMDHTNVGGNAWKNDGYEVRGIIRESTAIFDRAAVAALTLAKT